MKTLRNLLFVVVAATTSTLFAQQDQTAEWKASLNDLDRRLTSLTTDSGSSVEALRTDTEALRASLASFAESHPEISLKLPAALPENATRDALRQQLDQLQAAANEVVKSFS